MNRVKVILADWNGYSLKRKKVLGRNKINCGLGRLLRAINTQNSGVDFELYLVINTDKLVPDSVFASIFGKRSVPKKKYISLKSKYPFVKKIFFRNNQGMDIGAYDYGLELLRKEHYTGDVLFLNSSVVGPKDDNWLKKYQLLFYKNDNTGMCGISLNSHNTISDEKAFMPHIQSFFLYTNMDVLEHVFPDGFLDKSINYDKQKLILDGEIGISTRVINAGYCITASSFSDFRYFAGDKWGIPEGDIRFTDEYKHLINKI